MGESEIEERFVSAFSMSSEEFERQLEVEYQQASPEERAEFESLVEQANAALPKMNASMDRMGKKMGEMNAAMDELKRCMSSLDVRISRIEGKVGNMLSTPDLSPEGEGRS